MYIVRVCLTHIPRTLKESFGSNRSRPQKNEDGAFCKTQMPIVAGSIGSLRIHANVSGLMRSIEPTHCGQIPIDKD